MRRLQNNYQKRKKERKKKKRKKKMNNVVNMFINRAAIFDPWMEFQRDEIHL